MKRTQKHTSYFSRVLPVILLLIAFTAISCSKTPMSPIDNNNNDGDGGENPQGNGKVMGAVVVTIVGIGTSQMTASVKPVSLFGIAGVSSQLSNVPAEASSGTPNVSAGFNPLDTDPPDIGIEMDNTGNEILTYNSTNTRYVSTTFAVRNARYDGDTNLFDNIRKHGKPYSVPHKNLTFIAANSDQGPYQTYGQTPIVYMQAVSGEVTDLSKIRQVVPTAKVDILESGEIVPVTDVLQVFTEGEISSNNIPPLPDNINYLFPYGFVVRTQDVTPGSRKLRADPSNSQFDGVVNFAYKLPQTGDRVTVISALYVIYEDQTTRMTQSPQELTQQYAQKIVNDIDTHLNDNIAYVTLLPSSNFHSLFPLITYRRLCTEVRVAGAPGNATKTLFTPSEVSACKANHTNDYGPNPQN